MTALRIVSTDPRLTRPARSWSGAEERARRVALLVGSAEIQQRERTGAWLTIERFECISGRVRRREER